MSNTLLVTQCRLADLIKQDFANDAVSHHAALICDDEVCQLSLQMSRSLVGCVFMGTIVRIVPALSCAFVDIGQRNHGILSFKDMAQKQSCHQGAKIIVQVKRDALGDKGAQLSGKIYLQSAHIVYQPTLPSAIHISHKIKDKDRLKKALLDGLSEPIVGDFIVRTSAKQLSADKILQEMQVLTQIWQNIQQMRSKHYKNKHQLLYQAPPKFILNHIHDIQSITSDDEVFLNQLQNLAIFNNVKFHLSHSSAPLYDAPVIQNAIKSALARRINLPSGGYIVIEKTEAMTVIDVNSGSQTNHSSAQAINIEAAKQIAKQLRLRQVGGMVIVDFISMSQADYDDFFVAIKQTFNFLTPNIYKVALGLILLNIEQTQPDVAGVISQHEPVLIK